MFINFQKYTPKSNYSGYKNYLYTIVSIIEFLC